MTPREFVEKFREAFGDAAPLPTMYRSILLFDSHGFCQVAGFIDIATLIYGDVISEQLQRYRGNDRR